MRLLHTLIAVVLVALLGAGAAQAQPSGFRLQAAQADVVIAPPPAPPAEATILFGAENWAGYGRDCSLGLPPGLPVSGADAGTNDFGQDADGCFIPRPLQAYGSVAAFTKPAGSTWNYLFGTTAVTFQTVAGARFVTNLPTDSEDNYQFKNTLQRAYTVDGAPELGDRIILRDEAVLSFPANSWNIVGPVGGYKGLYTSLTGGSGYTDGTHQDVAVSYVSGSGGSGMLVSAIVASGAVTHVWIRDWGDQLYQPGDVLTAAVPGGSGFQFTLSANINEDDGWIFVQSETPDLTTVLEGNFTWGGSARLEGSLWNGGGFLPIMFEYVDLVWPHGTPPVTPATFVTYADNSLPWAAWGVSGRRNFISVPNTADGSEWARDGIMARLALWEYNHVAFLDNAFLLSGPTPDTMAVKTKTRIENNVIHDMWVDCVKSSAGVGFIVRRNLCYDWRIAGASHGDALQILGSNYGVTNQDMLLAEENIWLRGAGEGTGEAQGFITTGMSSPAMHGGGRFFRNFFWGNALNAFSLSRWLDPEVKYNFGLAVLDAPSFEGTTPLNSLRLLSGSGGDVSHNIMNAYAFETQTGYAHDSVSNVTIALSGPVYASIMVDPKWGPYSTRAAFLADKTPLPTGPHMLGDGTVAYPLFPACTAYGQTTGAWNDGSVWNCDDADWRAAHPSAQLILFGAAAYRRRRRAANDNAPVEGVRAA